MADAASPYTPGIVGDEPAPPRPPSRAWLFLAALFAMTLIGPGFLWYPWSRLFADVGLGGFRALLPVLLLLTWAFLADVVPVMGPRREGQLLVGALLGAVAWLALLPLEHIDWAWPYVGLGIGVARAVADVAITGAFVEIGQRRRSTGRLAAAWVAVGAAAELAAIPLAQVFSDAHPGWIVGTCSGLAFVVVILIAALPEPAAAEPSPSPPARVTLPSFLRSRAFWGSLAVVVCAAVAVVPNATIALHLRPKLEWTSDQIRAASVSQTIAHLVSAAVYVLICRRMAFAALLRLAMLAQVLTTVALVAVWDETGGPSYLLTMSVGAAGDQLAWIAVLDLAMRAAPIGREAFGCVILTLPLEAIRGTINPLAKSMRMSLTTASTAAVVAGVLAMLAVWLLPASVVARREGEG